MFAADRYGSGVKFAELPLPFRQFPRVILSWTPLEACTRAKTDGVRERSRRRDVILLYRFTAPSHGNDLGSNPSRSISFLPPSYGFSLRYHVCSTQRTDPASSKDSHTTVQSFVFPFCDTYRVRRTRLYPHSRRAVRVFGQQPKCHPLTGRLGLWRGR